ALAAAVVVLDLAVVVHLAGSPRAAAMFVAFVACIVVPVVFLARGIAPLAMVILAAVPWFFLRKATGMPLVVDVATAAVLIACAFRWGSLPRVRMPAVTFVVVPILFSVVWLGWNAPLGNEIREYGLFGIDFGNLVAVVSTIRASPALPTRNHLLLSPLNSMVTFGNNSAALVLAIVALVQLETWNRDGRLRDLIVGAIALAAIIGYSITLLFPLALALLVWTLLGRV